MEAHHLLPLAKGEERTTRLEDLALLGANCHCLVHSSIPPLNLDETRELVRARSNHEVAG